MSATTQPDPRFEAVLNLIRSGEFGWEGYFAQLIDSLNGSSDYYLLANDFPSYLEAQVRPTLFSTGSNRTGFGVLHQCQHAFKPLPFPLAKTLHACLTYHSC